jgi:hypothetical protein
MEKPAFSKIGNMVLSIEEIRYRFDKGGRMNCRDIADLIEWIDYLQEQLNGKV